MTDAQGVARITNDDALPSFSTRRSSDPEGNSGTVNAVFTVSLSAASGQTVTVDYATANGTAIAPGDYTALSTTMLTFAPGGASNRTTVTQNGDTLTETNETFAVNLSNAT